MGQRAAARPRRPFVQRNNFSIVPWARIEGYHRAEATPAAQMGPHTTHRRIRVRRESRTLGWSAVNGRPQHHKRDGSPWMTQSSMVLVSGEKLTPTFITARPSAKNGNG